MYVFNPNRSIKTEINLNLLVEFNSNLSMAIPLEFNPNMPLSYKLNKL